MIFASSCPGLIERDSKKNICIHIFLIKVIYKNKKQKRESERKNELIKLN